jgi:hypothetical protein
MGTAAISCDINDLMHSVADFPPNNRNNRLRAYLPAKTLGWHSGWDQKFTLAHRSGPSVETNRLGLAKVPTAEGRDEQDPQARGHGMDKPFALNGPSRPLTDAEPRIGRIAGA